MLVFQVLVIYAIFIIQACSSYSNYVPILFIHYWIHTLYDQLTPNALNRLLMAICGSNIVFATGINMWFHWSSINVYVLLACSCCADLPTNWHVRWYSLCTLLRIAHVSNVWMWYVCIARNTIQHLQYWDIYIYVYASIACVEK